MHRRRPCSRSSPTSSRVQAGWIVSGSALGADARERVAADTAGDGPRPDAALHHVLQRTPGETPADVGPRPRSGRRRDRAAQVAPMSIGSASRPAERSSAPSGAARGRQQGEPSRTETRLLAAAADQVGPGAAPGQARGAGAGRGDRPPERRAQIGAAAVRVARPAHPARDHSRRSRDARAEQQAQRGRISRRASTRSIARSSTSTDS